MIGDGGKKEYEYKLQKGIVKQIYPDAELRKYYKCQPMQVVNLYNNTYQTVDTLITKLCVRSKGQEYKPQFGSFYINYTSDLSPFYS